MLKHYNIIKNLCSRVAPRELHTILPSPIDGIGQQAHPDLVVVCWAGVLFACKETAATMPVLSPRHACPEGESLTTFGRLNAEGRPQRPRPGARCTILVVREVGREQGRVECEADRLPADGLCGFPLALQPAARSDRRGLWRGTSAREASRRQHRESDLKVK